MNLATVTQPKIWPPDYVDVFSERQRQVMKLREVKALQVGAKEYYRTRPVDFITHWCDTYDPRNLATGGSARIPFILFQRQREFIEFLHACLLGEGNGLVEKSRDMGATWGACGFSIWLWLFWEGAAVGWGSRKEVLVDRIGDASSIFEKMRMIVRGLPNEFLPVGFKPDVHMTYMRFVNPETDASITGESGDNLGRGGRTLIYMKDESAHYEHAEKIEAALMDNTRVQIDISSVLGGTIFQRKRDAGIEYVPGMNIVKGKTHVFVLDWRDHPEKTEHWHKQREDTARDNGLLHVFAQEVDRDYAASVDGVIIPTAYVTAAIDAHVKLGFNDSGAWGAALDVADEGGDTNALAKRKGVILKSVEEWGERDTGITTRRAVKGCTDLGPIELQYDCIGIGSGVKAESNRLKDDNLMPKNIRLVPWNAGDEVQDKDKHMGMLANGYPDRDTPLNGDFFTNFKAQAWWALRRRFETTYRAINEPGFTFKVEDLISLPSDLPLLQKLRKELSQATSSLGSRLKMVVDKAPEGAKSPNLADSVVMLYFPVRISRPIIVSADTLARARGLMR